MKLYELTSEAAKLIEDGCSISDLLDRLPINDKVSNCLAVIKQLEAESSALLTEINKMQLRKRANDNKSDALRAYVVHNMQALSMIMAGNELHKARLVNPNKTVIRLIDESIIPNEYFVMKKEIDRKKLKADLEDGLFIEGAELCSSPMFLKIV